MAKRSCQRIEGSNASKIKRELRFGPNVRYRLYRLRWNMAPKFKYVTRFPTHVDFETTNNCNLRCVMCPREFMKEEKGFMDMGLFKKIIDEGSDKGLKSIKLNWRGEPLMHKELVDMVRYAKDKGVIEVMFNTNGLLLTEKKSKELIGAGLDKIIFSVDGATKETYEKIRRGGNYDILIKNIMNLIEIRKASKSNKPHIRVQMVKMKENAHETDKFIDFWKPLVEYVAINDVVTWETAEDRTLNEYVAVGRAQCPQPWQRLMIDWNGDVAMCCGDWSKKNPLGNARKQSIKEIWHSDLLNKYRKMLAEGEANKIEACKKCPVAESIKWKKSEK